VAGVALLVLGPPSLLVRSWRRWRRGSEARVEHSTRRIGSGGGAELALLDLRVDVPLSSADGFRRSLTDVLIRVAERLRRADDVYYLVYRLPETAETTLLAVGPLVQNFGEWLSLTLGRPELAHRTVLWLALPASRGIAEVLDPFAYDPEAPGEPSRVAVSGTVRWAVAGSFANSDAAMLYRVLLWVPLAAAPDVERICDRLETRFG
jgi:hypothetical protein